MAEDNNSLSRANERPSAEERRKDLPVYSGVKQVKKKDPGGVWRWIARMFFSGRSVKEIAMDVLEHEVVPTMQDGVRNSAVSMIDQLIYRDRKPGAVNTTAPGSFITNYVAYGDKKKQQQAALEATKQKEEETVKSGFELPAFGGNNFSEGERFANDFLASMHAYVQKYETLSVQDLAWMQGKSVDFTWDKWGWYRDEILAIKKPSRFTQPVYADDGKGNKIKLTHYIDMPKAHEFD